MALQPGVNLWTPPPYNSEGFLGWAPATPSFFGHRSLVWLVAGAPFRFVVHAPCQKGKKKCFHPMCLYSIYSEFSRKFKNAQKWAFSSHPKIIISFVTVCLSKMSSILVDSLELNAGQVAGQMAKLRVYA